MAIVENNSVTKGLSGRLGQALVFKSLRGKTIVAQRTAPTKKQSEQQRANRNKFKEATAFAKAAPLWLSVYSKQAA